MKRFQFQNIRFWLRKILKGQNKRLLLKRVLTKKSFRYFREALFLVRHPFDLDLLNVGEVRSPLLIDIGAFDGTFATKFRAKYRDCSLVLIEPVEVFIKKMPPDLQNHKTVVVNKGLTKDGRDLQLNISGADTSSFGKKNGENSIVQTISVLELHELVGNQEIDLFQINCEGGEYEILPEVIKSPLISQIANIQIQFHYLSVKNMVRHAVIRGNLRKTHKLVWSTYFIWERWEKHEAS